jgi:maltooligosyltrehalose trehalohydrolase
MSWSLTLGARPTPAGVRFRVWAPAARRVDVVLYDAQGGEAAHALAAEPGGYFTGLVADAGPGARYRYRLDGGDAYPDPASRSQPDGVHAPSAVVDPDAFAWTDAAWPGLPADGLVLYELHVGTFTEAGTFDAAIERLDHVAALGVTAVEVMPIAAFPGQRNWGYDGVGLYAPAAPYGGPDAFKRFVDAAHARGLGVVLDAVYNHFGPDGNYLWALTGGRFFTDRHHTPWGDAVAYDGPDGAAVRDFVVQNALYWAHEYHVDGLRLDATHAIHDGSPVHVLQEIGERLHALDRPRLAIAEDERNERRLLLPVAEGGLGLDGVWADDLHHQLRRLAAGDAEGYFRPFGGTVADVVATLRQGWYFEGQDAGGHARGTPAAGLPPRAFVHCLQNHDQVGNRAMGDRLHHAIPPALWRALSALLLLSPYTPLLWMGQEWAASTPFQFFTDHNAELGRLVTEGRRGEFAAFSAFSDPAVRTRIPDPQDEATFLRSKLRWDEREAPAHAPVLALYRALLALRRDEPALRTTDRAHFEVAALDGAAGAGALALRRSSAAGDCLLTVVSFGASLAHRLDADAATRAPEGARWARVLSTEEARFGGAEADVRDGTVDVVALGAPGAVVLRAAAAPHAVRAA